MADAPRDSNRVPALLATSSADGITPVPVYANPTTHKLEVDASLEVGDIEIGAVEIKNSTDDTRATVGANGLYVDVRNTIGQLIDVDYDYVGVTWTVGTFTEVFVFKTGGSGGATVATVTVIYTDATKVQLVSVTKS